MAQRTTAAPLALFDPDETAWLEYMVELIRAERYDELDYVHLQEYLADMAKRDRREVQSRLATLIADLLKWKHQPKNRSGSWQATILEQAQELEALLESEVLRTHAPAVLSDAYAKGSKRAAAETGLSIKSFPSDCPFTLDELLSGEPGSQG